jgi:MFS family permease
VVSNIGTLMQGVGAAWLMTSLTKSPVPVALLTTSASLPLFLVGLPAGALADVVDRRWLLIVTQLWMLIAAAIMSFLAWTGQMAPWSLLTLTFLLGIGGALSAPAWQAVVPELVGKEDLPQAVALNGAGFNLARAVGPAIGGLIVAAAGAWAVFLLNAVSFVGVMLVIYRWRPAARENSLPPETVRGAVQAGLRYARFAPTLHAVLIRTGVFILAGSALWSLLPVVANHELGLSATGYGVLLGSLGLGAVLGAVFRPRIGDKLSLDQQVAASTVIFAGGILALAYVHNLWLLNAALLAVGVAWLVLTSSLNVAAQTTSPGWVTARALGVYLLVFQGGMAAGSAAWGALASRVGNPTALLVAAVALVVGLAIALRWPLKTGQDLDLTPAEPWPTPEVVSEPHPEEGPVMVTAEYCVPEAHADAFVRVMTELGPLRRRDGATNWELFRDPANPERFVEMFIVPSWAEHLRQHERMTVADRETEERALAFHQDDHPVVVSHLVAARAMSPVEPGVEIRA